MRATLRIPSGRALRRGARVLLLAGLAFGAIAWGGRESDARSLLLLATLLAGLLVLAAEAREVPETPPTPPLGPAPSEPGASLGSGAPEKPSETAGARILVGTLGALGVLVALQGIPWPRAILALLSPARVALAAEVERIGGAGPAGWLSPSVSLASTRGALGLFLAALAAFGASRRLFARARRLRGLSAGLVVLGAGLSVYGLAALASGGPTKPLLGLPVLVPLRLSASFANPDRFATLLEMLLPLAAALALRAAVRPERREDPSPRPGVLSRLRRQVPKELRRPLAVGAWSLCAAAMLAAIILTFCRAAVPALVAGGAIGFLLAGRALVPRSSEGVRAGRLRAGILSAALLLVAAGVFLTVLAPARVADRFAAFGEGLPEAAPVAGRLVIWKQALRVAADYPVLGSGAGTFEAIFPRYQTPKAPNYYRFAHNDYLDLLSNLGPLGAAAALAAAAAFFASLARSLRRAREASDRDRADRAPGEGRKGDHERREAILLSAAAAAGLLAVCVHAAMDFCLDPPANVLIFSTLAGAALGAAQRAAGELPEGDAPAPVPRKRLRRRRLALAGILLLAVLPTARTLLAEVLARRADDPALSAEDRLGALALPRRLDPRSRRRAFEEARLLAEAARGRAAPGREELLRRSEGILGRLTAREPAFPEALLLRGAVLGGLGSLPAADRAVEAAERSAPVWPEIQASAGAHWLRRLRAGAGPAGQPAGPAEAAADPAFEGKALVAFAQSAAVDGSPARLRAFLESLREASVPMERWRGIVPERPWPLREFARWAEELAAASARPSPALEAEALRGYRSAAEIARSDGSPGAASLFFELARFSLVTAERERKLAGDPAGDPASAPALETADLLLAEGLAALAQSAATTPGKDARALPGRMRQAASFLSSPEALAFARTWAERAGVEREFPPEALRAFREALAARAPPPPRPPAPREKR